MINKTFYLPSPYDCRFCGIKLNSQKDLNAHIAGKKHRKKLEHQKYNWGKWEKPFDQYSLE